MLKPYYEQDGITIYCGDCREILPQLDVKVDLVLTDPPYGINADKTQNDNARSGRVSNGGYWKEYEYTAWDKNAPDSKLFEMIFNKSKNQIIWGGNYFFLPSRCQWLIWNKVQRGVMTDGEMAWTNKQGSLKIFDMARTDAYINTTELKHHPTQKPTPLISWCLSLYPEAQTILDPFLGSGTTAVAAKILGRKCIGIEIEEKYCEIAVKRLAQSVMRLE